MSEIKPFRSRIERFAAARRHVHNAALGYQLGVVAAVAMTLGLLVLAGWLPNALVNLGLFVALLVVLVVLGVRYWLGFERKRSLMSEAFHMQHLVDGLDSRIVAAVDFAQRDDRTPLMDAVIARAATDLDHDYESQIDRSERDEHRKHFAIAAVVLLVVAFSPWFGVHRLWSNVGQSWLAFVDMLFPVRYALEPGEGMHVYRLGEEAPVNLTFSRRGFDEVTLVTQQGDDPAQQVVLPVDEQGAVAHVVSRDVETDVKLHFEFGGRQTESATLVFTRPPSLVNMQTELIYPGYTRMLPRTLEGVQQRLIALDGTRVTMGMTFSKDLESATMTWDDGSQPLALETMGRFASTSLLHSRQRQAQLQVVDEHGFSMEYPIVVDFDLQQDELPRLFLPRHLKADMPMLPEAAKVFGFGVRTQDDYGVTRCVLKWQRSTVDNPTQILDQGEVERMVSPPQRQAVVSFQEVFGSMELQPGDRIAFQVEVYDNRQPQAQRTASRRCSFFIYQEELGGLNVAQLGFNKALQEEGGRIRKSRKPSVKAPEGIRSSEKVVNEHEAKVSTATQAPTVRGEHRQATEDYFRLLSGLSFEERQAQDATDDADSQPAPSPAE